MSQIYSVMFHDLYDIGGESTQGAINWKEFQKIVEVIRKSDLISSAEVLNDSTTEDLEQKIFITFDDGLLRQFELGLDWLDKLDIVACFFVHTSPLLGDYDVHQLLRTLKNSNIFQGVEEFNKKFINHLQSDYTQHEIDKIDNSFSQKGYFNQFTFYSDSDKKLRFIRDHYISQDEYKEKAISFIHSFNIDTDSLAEDTYMTGDNLKTIAERGHVVGLHSHSHPSNLGSLSDQEQFTELKRNKEVIESMIGIPPKTISYPSNSYNSQTISHLIDLDIYSGFRADDKITKAPYELARIDARMFYEEII